MQLVNFDLLKNPVNWVIVWLMLVFAAIALSLAAKPMRQLSVSA